MNSLNFCGPSATVVYPFHGVSSMLLELHQQMAEQYQVYSAGSPAAHTLSVAERLAGRVGHAAPPPGKHHPEQLLNSRGLEGSKKLDLVCRIPQNQKSRSLI